MNFFDQFDSQWGPRLEFRRDSFRASFEYILKKRATGHLIVETGCARNANNWQGDGQSTYLFDCFASAYDGQVISVDIDPKACAHAKSVVGSRTTVHTEDSISFLHKLARQLLATQRHIDLLYLDAHDYDFANPIPSAVHHLKELCAISPALAPGTLVVVDDSFRILTCIRPELGKYIILGDMGIEGKAKFVAQYFKQIGAQQVIDSYQCGWTIPD